jgi:hypothetical protein
LQVTGIAIKQNPEKGRPVECCQNSGHFDGLCIFYHPIIEITSFLGPHHALGLNIFVGKKKKNRVTQACFKKVKKKK